MNEQRKYQQESHECIVSLSEDKDVKSISQQWIDKTGKHRYVYNWHWLGLPIIQLPQDIVVSQELIWEIKPTLIVETGVARGGSLAFYASQLALLDLTENGNASTSEQSKRRCVGIDIDIRPHNRKAIEAHPLSNYIKLIQGSSISKEVLDNLKNEIRSDDVVLIILDSNHTYAHVKDELELYAPLVTKGSYLIVHDTGIEFAPKNSFLDRDWGKGNNPLTAVNEFLSHNEDYEIDKLKNDKLLITSSPDGYIKKQK